MPTYEYNLPDIPIHEFERMRHWVNEAYRDSLRSKRDFESFSVVQVTVNKRQMPYSLACQVEEETGSYVGLAWPGQGYIWIRPGRDIFDMKKTAVHELSHLRVADQAHGPKWRRVNAVAFALYLREFHPNLSWQEVRQQMGQVVYAYRKRRRFTPDGRYNSHEEWARKTEAEYLKCVQSAKRLAHAWGLY